LAVPKDGELLPGRFSFWILLQVEVALFILPVLPWHQSARREM